MICDFMSQCELEHIQSMNNCVPHEKLINLLSIRNLVLRTLLPEVEIYYVRGDTLPV